MLLLAALWGCQTSRRIASTTRPVGSIVAPVHATCFPPTDWSPEPLKSGQNNAHQIWLSPTGHTAYGVIHFDLPFPVGDNVVLFFFLQEMRNHEGQAALLEKHWDQATSTLRFVAQGGRYTARAKMKVGNFEGWIAYAGTRTDESIIPDELEEAEEARDQTQIGP